MIPCSPRYVFIIYEHSVRRLINHYCKSSVTSPYNGPRLDRAQVSYYPCRLFLLFPLSVIFDTNVHTLQRLATEDMGNILLQLEEAIHANSFAKEGRLSLSSLVIVRVLHRLYLQY